MQADLNDEINRVLKANLKMVVDMSHKRGPTEVVDAFFNALANCMGYLAAPFPIEQRREMCHKVSKHIVECIMEKGREYDEERGLENDRNS